MKKHYLKPGDVVVIYDSIEFVVADDCRSLQLEDHKQLDTCTMLGFFSEEKRRNYAVTRTKSGRYYYEN